MCVNESLCALSEEAKQRQSEVQPRGEEFRERGREREKSKEGENRERENYGDRINASEYFKLISLYSASFDHTLQPGHS